MSARYRLGSLANSGDIPRIQRKLEDLYDNYNYSSNCTNYSKCADLIDENSRVQDKLYSSLTDIATDSTSPLYTSSSCTRPYTSSCYTSSCYYPRYYSRYYPYYYYYPYTCTSGLAAASAALAATSRLSSELCHKNAELSDLSYKYSRDVNHLESHLTSAECEKSTLKHELDHVKDELFDTKRSSRADKFEAERKAAELKSKLQSAELKLALTEPKAALANTYERQIANLNSDLRFERNRNTILKSHNDFQDKLLRSRPSSPCFLRSCSPICTYRRTYDSDLCAPLVSHHVWPCLTRDRCVLAKGDACTLRAPSLCFRSRPCSPVLSHRTRLRSCSPICTRAISPLTTTTTTVTTRTYSPVRCWY